MYTYCAMAIGDKSCILIFAGGEKLSENSVVRIHKNT